MLKDKEIIDFHDIFVTVAALQDVLLAFFKRSPSGSGDSVFTDSTGNSISGKEICGSIIKSICEDIILSVDKEIKEG